VTGWLQAAVVIALVGALHVPLGDYMARAFTAPALAGGAGDLSPRRHGSRRRPALAALIRSLFATSVAGIVVLYLLLRLQGHLPFSLGHPGMSPALAFDTAVSFTTNTSWQNYAGESTLGYLAQAAGLGVEAFLSAAVGLAAVLALIRGIVRRETNRVGNFWVDLIRAVTRVLLPLAFGFAVLLAGLGVIENLNAGTRSPRSPGAGRRSRAGWSRPGNRSS
jgi:K+-transporting ATPase A subunit